MAKDKADYDRLFDLEKICSNSLLILRWYVKYDMSLQLKDLYSVSAAVTERQRVLLRDLLEPFVYEYIASKKGSISAEHGIGFHKKGKLHYTRSDIEIRFMKDIKITTIQMES
ncbi:CFC_collapsed_G0047670.mRNA.1.CDS.1 [Saccharomyces cerevisiae]|nr:CFC_collapsed_G0047670.mRNA.1.CDS.1 [Saccharomyces cerevisiae]